MPPFSNRRHLALAVLVTLSMGLLAVACGGSDDDGSNEGGSASTTTESVEVSIGPEAAQAVLVAAADDVAIPNLEALRERLDDLAAAMTAACATPGNTDLDAARAAWAEADDAWERARVVNLGPTMDLRLMSFVAYAANGPKVVKLLDDAEPITPASISSGGAHLRGIFGLVPILFAGSHGAEAGAYPIGERSCAYADAVLTVATDHTSEAIEAWTADDGYRATLAADASAAQDVLSDLVNTLISSVRDAHDKRLKPMGLAAAGEEASLPDDPGGRLTLSLAARMDAVAAAFDGVDGAPGVASLLPDGSDDVASRTSDALAAARSDLAALDGSVADVVAEDPDGVTAAVTAASDAKVALSTEVATLLGVTVGFGDSDGDA